MLGTVVPAEGAGGGLVSRPGDISSLFRFGELARYVRLLVIGSPDIKVSGQGLAQAHYHVPNRRRRRYPLFAHAVSLLQASRGSLGACVEASRFPLHMRSM